MQWLNNELRVSVYTLFVDWAVDRGAHFAVPVLHRTAAIIHNQAGRQYHSSLYTTLPIVNAPFCHVFKQPELGCNATQSRKAIPQRILAKSTGKAKQILIASHAVSP